MCVLLLACGTAGFDLAPGSTRWEDRVRQTLLRHDLDGTGLLEQEEVENLACAELGTFAAQWEQAHEGSFWTAYGLAPGLLFRGERLGLAASSLPALATLSARCSAGAPSVDDPTVGRISVLEAPSSDAWDRQVAAILLEVFDRDASGWLDRPLEVQDISCDVYLTLDRAIRSTSDVGLFTLYGVDPTLIWVGGGLGFEDAMREVLGDRLTECGIGPDGGP